MKTLLMHIITVLAYLNCHMIIVVVVVLADTHLVAVCL